MSKEICISSTPHETRLAILEDDQLAEIYYERENEYTLAGSIYKGRVTRVLPGMQSAFVDIGLERDAFLYVTDFLEEQEDSEEFERIPPSGGRREGKSEGRERSESRGEGRPESRRRPAPDTVRDQPAAVAPPAEPEGGHAAGGEDENTQGGARRWRGRRGRRRGGRTGQPREAQAGETHGAEVSEIEIEVDSASDFHRIDSVEAAHAQPEVIPEAFSEPSSSTTYAAPVSAPSTPILLPGESLSRYGGAPRAASPAAEPVAAKPAASAFTPSYVAPKPSTLIQTPIEWDGKGPLPGESISRHRNVPARQETAPEIPAAVPEIEPETEPEVETAAIHVEAGEQPSEAAVAEAVAEVPVEPAPEAAAPHHEAVAEAPLAETPEPVSPEPVTLEPVIPELHTAEAPAAEPVEFEPEEGSVSYRIDPSAPSELRVTPVIEEEAPAAEEATAPVSEEAEAPAHEVHALEAAIEAPVEVQPEAPAEIHAASAVESVTGVAEAPFEVEYEEQEADEPTGPAIPAHEIETVEDDEQNGGQNGFAPGSGLLEEETIDEEEYDLDPIHAHADEQDLEDLEEETLEHQAGAISDLVRDTHLAQRLGPAYDEVTDEEEVEQEGEEGEDEDEDEEEGPSEAGGFTEADFEIEDADADADEEEPASGDAPAPARQGGREDRRGRGRGRRRHGGGGGGGGRRQSAQTTDLPIISDLLKQGQEILVQIAKEPIAKKGARITSHIALPGRFLVFMPTVNHVGVSRKISSDEERQRLKHILISEKGSATGGFIVRTAADGASEEELRADIRFLISLWTEIKRRSDDGKAPALIYHDLNLVERILRDQVSDNFSAIWVDSESEYERIVRFLNRFQPSLVRRVKLYTKETPLFEHFGIQEEIGKALKSKVWLKSGGSIVINQTEALVAIDINTGKYVGKTARLEDTILRTNLDAIPEIVRQIRLRDLGGIIVIDFIDMDERKNRHKVMAALEEELKHDRAPSKVLQFNDFGLVAITRKRVKQSLERTLSVQCNVCQGTGMVKSPTTVCNEIYSEMRKMQRHFDRSDVLLRVNPEVVKTLKANNGRWLNELEEMTGKTIIVKSDPALHPEQFDVQ